MTRRLVRRAERPRANERDLHPIVVEIEPHGGIVVRWYDWALLIDPVGAWLVHDGRVLWGVRIGQA